MTRTQAWRKVAEAFGTPLEQRSEAQRSLTLDGLCWALSEVLGGVSVAPVYDAMAELRDAFRLLDKWWWPKRGFGVVPHPDWTPECDTERATFAALMAAMTQRERDQLAEGL